MHELCHCMGSGVHSNWSMCVRGNPEVWSRPHGRNLFKEWEGGSAELGADYHHLHKYNMNYEHEDSPENRVRMCQLIHACLKDCDEYTQPASEQCEPSDEELQVRVPASTLILSFPPLPLVRLTGRSTPTSRMPMDRRKTRASGSGRSTPPPMAAPSIAKATSRRGPNR